MSESIREVIARCHADRKMRWHELGSGEIADDVIAELAAYGFVIVPREPTGEMIEAGQRANNLDGTPGHFEFLAADEIAGAWRAMIDAALAGTDPATA